jgi:hypothetical protein
MINGHALFPPLSVVATIPADPEPRSGWSARSEARTNDLDGRRSLILPAGSHQELPGDGDHGHGMWLRAELQRLLIRCYALFTMQVSAGVGHA